MVGAFETYAKIVTKREGRRVCLSKGDVLNQGRVVGVTKLCHPSVRSCWEGRKRIDKQGVSGGIKRVELAPLIERGHTE